MGDMSRTENGSGVPYWALTDVMDVGMWKDFTPIFCGFVVFLDMKRERERDRKSVREERERKGKTEGERKRKRVREREREGGREK